MIEQLQAVWSELTGPGGGFAMSEVEVGGVPMRVFDAAFPSMRTVWELAAGHGDAVYVVYEDERYTYADIDARVRALAWYLRDTYGIGSGDRVAIAMRNYPEWIVSYWAVVSLGAAVVGMNAWWTTPEMDHGLRDSQPRVLISDDERLERVLPVLDDIRSAHALSIVAVRPTRELPVDAVEWTQVVIPASAPAGLPEATIDADDDVTIFYTSGTTGFAKGAQLTHRGSVHNMFHIAFWALCSATAAARIAAIDGRPPDAPVAGQIVQMTPTPLFHVTANNCSLHPITLAGGRLVYLRRWDPARALALIEREGVTGFSGVPTMGRELVAHPAFATTNTSSLRTLSGGGAPVQPDLVEKFNDAVAGSGGGPATGYGLTETNGIITANGSAFYLAKPLSCGVIMPTLDAKLVAEDGSDLPPGPDTVGELCVRGPIVVKGYLNRPEATAEAITDGWFHTGDIAKIDDDGFLFIVDRAKDMVLRGGENVYCSEVEAAIYRHDGVAEAAVFAVPDERLGEDVGAVIVRAPGVPLDADELRSFLGGRLARHKIPAKIWIRDEPLPRNANGKFVKRVLREEVVGA